MLKALNVRDGLFLSLCLSGVLAGSPANAQTPPPPQPQAADPIAPLAPERQAPLAGAPQSRGYEPQSLGQPGPVADGTAMVASGDSLYVLRSDTLYRLRASTLATVAQHSVPRPVALSQQAPLQPAPGMTGSPVPDALPRPEADRVTPSAAGPDTRLMPVPPAPGTPDASPAPRSEQETPPAGVLPSPDGVRPDDAPRPNPEAERRGKRRAQRGTRPQPAPMRRTLRMGPGMPEGTPGLSEKATGTMSVSGNTVYLLRGNMVYRFRASDLKLLDQRELVVPSVPAETPRRLDDRPFGNGALPPTPGSPGTPISI